MPLYHAAAMYMTLLMTHYWDVPTALGIGNRPLSSDLVLECLKYSGSDAVTLPPAILEEMSQTEESVETLAGLGLVAFGGGTAIGPPCWRSSADSVVQEILPAMQAIDWSKAVSS